MPDDTDQTTDDEPNDDYLPCRKCSEQIAPDADRCKHCGYEGYKDTKADALARMSLVGLLLTAFIITAPLGLPMFCIAFPGWLYCKLFRRDLWQPQER